MTAYAARRRVAALFLALIAFLLVLGPSPRVATAQTLPIVTLTLTSSSGQNQRIPEDGGVMTVTASMDSAAQGPVTVAVSVAPAPHDIYPLERAHPDDYTVSMNKVLTFAAGSTASTGTVTITGVGNDADQVSNRRIRVTGTVTGDATMPNGEKSAWWEFLIQDNDLAPFPTVVLTPSTISEKGGTSTVTVTLTNPTLKGDLVFDVELAPKPLVRFHPSQGPFENQADPGNVTLSANKRLTIKAGQTTSTGTVTITAVDNADDAPTLRLPVAVHNTVQSTVQLSVTRSGPPGGDVRLHTQYGDRSHYHLLEINDDDVPQVSFASAAARAGESAGTHNVTVNLNPAPHADIALGYTVGGTAAAGQNGDFTIANSGTLAVSAGATTATIPVAIADDSIAEPDETIVLTLTGGSGYAVGNPGVHTLTIADDDVSEVSFASAAARVGERAGAHNARVNLNPPPRSNITLNYTVGGTAVPGQGKDFTIANSGTVAVPAGAIAATIPVAISNDDIAEPDETVILTLTGSSDYAVGSPGAHTLTITDNDLAGIGLSAPALRLDDACSAARYTVRLLSEPEAAVTLTVESLAPGIARVSPSRLTFTPADWNSPRTVAVTGAGVGEAEIAHRAASADGIYRDKTATLGVRVAGGFEKAAAPWLARFSRGSAHEVVDGIAGRLTAPRTPGVKARIAGQAVESAPVPDGGAEAAGPLSRAMSGREALTGTAFAMTGADRADGGSWALWGRSALSRFEGREGAVSLDGETVSGTLGVERGRGRWLTGVALSHSAGEGGYDGACAGRMEAALTTIAPWASWKAADRVTVWGALGYGQGALTLEPKGGEAVETDIETGMAAAGAKGDLIEAPTGSGFGLAVATDALWLRADSEKAGAALGAMTARVSRLRFGLEGAWRRHMEDGRRLGTRLGAGLRRDGGDAETGWGLDAGGGASWADPARGLDLALEGRSLLAHDASGFRDTGVSASLGWDSNPASRLGPSLALRRGWGGASSGGLDRLLAAEAPRDSAAAGGFGRRLSAESAFGFPVFAGRFTGSPYLRYGRSDAARDYGLGWRLAARRASWLFFRVGGTRRTGRNAPPENRIEFAFVARW